MTKERALTIFEELRKKWAREIGGLYGRDLYSAVCLAIMALEQLSDSNFPAIEVGDVCRYKKDNKQPFIITRIYCGHDGFGKIEFFFDAIYEDGSVIEDGTLSLIERVGVSRKNIREHLNELFRGIPLEEKE